MINSEHNQIKELIVEHSGRLINSIGYQEIATDGSMGKLLSLVEVGRDNLRNLQD